MIVMVLIQDHSVEHVSKHWTKHLLTNSRQDQTSLRSTLSTAFHQLKVAPQFKFGAIPIPDSGNRNPIPGFRIPEFLREFGRKSVRILGNLKIRQICGDSGLISATFGRNLTKFWQI